MNGHRLTSVFCRLMVLIVLSGMTTLRADGAVVLMADEADVPKYSQFQNYAALMDPRNTDVSLGQPPAPPILTYQQLPTAGSANAGEQHVHVDPNNLDEWFNGTNPPPAPIRLYVQGDRTDINMGTYHCAPTSGAMVMQFWSTRPGRGAVGKGAATEVQFIDGVAGFMDTNDQNAAIRNADRRGHFATFLNKISAGLNDFVASRGLAANAALAVYSTAGYKGIIDANRPVILTANQGARIAHTVVGIGYVTDNTGTITQLVIRDPATNNASDQVAIPAGGQLDDVPGIKVGARFNTPGDISIATFDSSLANGFILDVQVPEPVPTLSPWGLTLLALFVVAAATWLFVRSLPAPAR